MVSESRKPVLVIGGGGHGKVLVDVLQKRAQQILGIVDPYHPPDYQILGVPVLGGDEVVAKYLPSEVRLINGIGSIKDTQQRYKIFEHFKTQNYEFSGVIHPNTICGQNLCLEEGVQIMAGAILQVGSCLGKNTIVNTGAILDHDCVIEDHCHIAPGVTLSGGVHVGQQTHIGTGAMVIQNIHIGKQCLIGAGAVVVHSLPDRAIAFGVPAKIVGQMDSSEDLLKSAKL